MRIVAWIGFAVVRWRSRRGLRDGAASTPDAKKQEALQTGVRGETYAYWYLRRLGYLFIAKNYAPSHSKGEIDLIGYDRDTLVFVEVRTRAVVQGATALPEMSITREKHHVLVRTAHYFLRDRRIEDCPIRFDVLAIDNRPDQPPLVRLHQAALSPVA